MIEFLRWLKEMLITAVFMSSCVSFVGSVTLCFKGNYSDAFLGSIISILGMVLYVIGKGVECGGEHIEKLKDI